jgi:hypothetical protein
MPYTAAKPPLKESIEQLRMRIPGWGVDRDPADRPSYPRERFDPEATGAHWDFPLRQHQVRPREHSIEHAGVTPVFGTSSPLKGISGLLRRLAYARYSEARAAHWLILLGADRVDTVESALSALVTRKPDNPIAETGVLSEFTRHGVASRWRAGRVDAKHQMLDPFLIAGPWIALVGATIYLILKGFRAAGTSRSKVVDT